MCKENKKEIQKNTTEKYAVFSQETRYSWLSVTSFKVFAIGLKFWTVSKDVRDVKDASE